MDGVKGILASRTMWGLALAAVSLVFPTIGAKMSIIGPDSYVEIASKFMEAIGLVIAGYGRINATKQIVPGATTTDTTKALLLLLALAPLLGACAGVQATRGPNGTVVVANAPPEAVAKVNTTIAKVDAGILKASTAAVQYCTQIKMLMQGVDVYVNSPKGQQVVDEAWTTINTTCANPPSSIGGLLVTLGQIYINIQAVRNGTV